MFRVLLFQVIQHYSWKFEFENITFSIFGIDYKKYLIFKHRLFSKIYNTCIFPFSIIMEMKVILDNSPPSPISIFLFLFVN